jgi:sulfur relay (sulfurtransferase) DsrF/TusC family protein
MAKILNIVETAYRATIEEQDDTALWLTQSLRNAGADIAVLLRASAVNYASKGQDGSGLTIGDIKNSHGPKIDQDVSKMIEKGIPIYLVEEDAKDRGITDSELIVGVKKISKKKLPELFDQFDDVWHW